MPCSLQASPTEWKVAIGQPTQCMPKSTKTRMVEGHRRMTLSTVISVVGSAIFCMLPVCAPGVTGRCADANNAANPASAGFSIGLLLCNKERLRDRAHAWRRTQGELP